MIDTDADSQQTRPELDRPIAQRANPGPVNYVYICGSGHSGSTLLEMFLACHPEMVAVGELQNMSHQISVERVCSCGALPRECARWQAVRDAVLARTGIDIFKNPHDFMVSRERPRHTLDSVLRIIGRFFSYTGFALPFLNALGYRSLLAGRRRMLANTALVCETIRRLSGVQIIVDSSKDYLRMREIYDYAPRGTVKVIYLGRDGRGCLWSGLKRRHGSPAKLAREWAKNQRRTRLMLKGVRPEDQLFVRYEELCSDLPGKLRRICEFIGVEYNDEMLNLTPNQHHTIAGNKIRVQRGMQVRVDTAWRDNLTPAQLRIFQRIAGAVNRRLGYQ